MGFGYTFVEVAARTLLQRLGSDETLARVTGFLETSRLAAMALGAIVAPVLVALFGIRGALLALGAVLPCSPYCAGGRCAPSISVPLSRSEISASCAAPRSSPPAR